MLLTFKKRSSTTGTESLPPAVSLSTYADEFPPLPIRDSSVLLPPSVQLSRPQSAMGPMSYASATGTGGLTRGDVVSMVMGTVKDMNRRRNNIVISGLPEVPGSSDSTLVVNFISHNFDEPTVPLSTMRLGRPSGTQGIRKLLVRLPSEHVASSLIRAAKQRRYTDQIYSSLNVFVNPDLNKEEAKLEYEKRSQRRSRQTSKPSTVTSVGGDVEGSSTGLSEPNSLLPSTVLRPQASAFQPSDANPIPVLSTRVTLPSTNVPINLVDLPVRTKSSTINASSSTVSADQL